MSTAAALALTSGMVVATGLVTAEGATPAVTIALATPQTTPGTTVKISGYLRPAQTQHPVVLQELIAGQWRTIRTHIQVKPAYAFWVTPTDYTRHTYRVVDRGNVSRTVELLSTDDTLPSGGRIQPAGTLTSANGSYRLRLVATGGMRIIGPAGQVVWAAHSGGNPGSRLVQQYRGSLVLVTPANHVLFNSGTDRFPGAEAVLTNSGALQIRANGVVRWSTASGTAPAPTPAPTTAPTTSPAPTATSTPKPSPSPTLSPKPTTSPTATTTPKPSPAPTVSPTPTATATPTPTPTPPPTDTLTYGTWASTTGPAAAKRFYGYPYGNPPQCTAGGACIADKWLFYQGQCVSWVAHRLNQMNAVPFSNYWRGVHWGSAYNWGSAARQAGVRVDQTPRLGSVAWWSHGHVGYVERVLSSQSFVLSEMNYDNRNGFKVSQITVYSSHWPTAFLHVKDR